jgi:hypothetical protein
MAEGRRPGGLTALAVLNFVFGGFATIFALLFLTGTILIKTGEAQARSNGAEIHVSMGILYLELLLMTVSSFTLIASGVGYLKQKRVLGRTIGNIYAVCSLAGTFVELGLAHGSFGLGTLIFMVYPVLTVILVNTTFKDDLVN